MTDLSETAILLISFQYYNIGFYDDKRPTLLRC